MAELINYTSAVETIKTAILQGQYQAAKDVNRVQLALYFAIGKKHPQKILWQRCVGYHQRTTQKRTSGTERLFGKQSQKYAEVLRKLGYS